MRRNYNVETDLKTNYFVTLELLMVANQVKYTLGSSQQLNKPSVKLYAIRIYPKDAVTKSPNNVTIVSATTFAQAALTLQDPASNNVVQQDQMTYYTINTDIKKERNFNGQQIDFTKSYISFPDTTQPTTDAGKVYVIEVEYRDDTDS